MSNHFNGWGSYFDRLERAKRKNPRAAEEYQKLADVRDFHEAMATQAWGRDGSFDHYKNCADWRDYMKKNVWSLNDRLEFFWRQLFCKHLNVVRDGDAYHTCKDCGASGVYGIDFGVTIRRTKKSERKFQIEQTLMREAGF